MGDTISRLGVWFTRNIYIPGLKRYDGTAMGVAKVRMAETLVADKDQRVIDDPYAKNFIIGAWAMELMGAEVIHKKYDEFWPGLYSMIVGRTKFLDELCRNGCDQHGCTQLLILGAGYDTRCIRLNLSIPCFEVDQPEVHVLKKAGLDCLTLTEEQRSRVHLIPVDFNEESESSSEGEGELLPSILVRQVENYEGFVKGAKTIVLFEGVTQYIPKESTAKTLKQLSNLVGKGSILGISYVNEATYSSDPQTVKEEIGVDQDILKSNLKTMERMGEPWVTGWSRDSFQEFLSAHLFQVKEDACISDLEGKYFTPRGVTASPFCNVERFVYAELI